MDAIAIIGFSFKLPGGAEDASSFWDMLQAGRNVMRDWPESRLNIDAFHEADTSKKNMIHPRGAHFLQDDPGLFDAPFFSITAREAAAMDPQQRLLLETSYRALENAGISMAEVNQSQTAVYEASMVDDYNKFMSKDPDTMPQTTATGTAHAIMANRISWFFNFLGPSLHVDTACSSGMVALDLACQSLRSRDSTMALVAGSNLILGPEGSIMLSRMNFLSPDSLCYSFDHRANGYARGEGTIVMILKRLSDAISHGDTIRAIIRATGSNQDGHTPAIVQPSADAQEKLIRNVYRKAGLDFETTRYFEAHGTGTPVGDPIEMGAIGRVFRTSRSPEEPLYVGSVKTNIGHLEGASGLAGVLKAMLILEKGVIPPNANFEKVNPNLDTDFYNTRIPDRCIPWPSEGLRRISVNSFGFGGSNGHVILDDALHYLEEHNLSANHCTVPQPSNVTSSRLPNGHSSGNGHDSMTNGLTNGVVRINGDNKLDGVKRLNGVNGASPSASTPRLLIWSAADERTLGRLVEDYKSYCETKVAKGDFDIDRLAYTLSSRRSHLLWRSFALLDNHADTQEKSIVASKSQRSSAQTGIAFVFTGQGAQYAEMGLDLIQYPVFRETLYRINDAFASFGCSWDLFAEIKSPDNINRPEYSQPLCTALQIALVELLRSVRIETSVVVGHSSGEIAAAYTIGALTLESACRVAYYRGLLAGRLVATATRPGAMMSVNLPKDKVADYVENHFPDPETRPRITVACVNSPLNVTVSGDETVIDVLEAKLRHDKIFAQKLKTGISYHSPAMEVLASRYLKLMGRLNQAVVKPPGIRMISSVTGKPVDSYTLSQAQYWVSNLVSPVQFNEALQYIISATTRVKVGSATSKTVFDLVEVGPHAALRRPCMDIVQNSSRKKDIRYNSVLLRQKSPITTVLELVGNLYSYGYPVSVTEANALKQSKTQEQHAFLLDTPYYPFDHSKRYWNESRASYDYRMRSLVPRDVLGTRAQDWNPLQPKWRKIINVDELPWVADHVVNGSALFPATGMLVMAIEAAKQVAQKDRPITAYFIKEATFLSPIVLKPSAEGGDSIETMLTLHPIWKPYEKESVWSEIWICTYYNGTWTECFRATIQTQYKETRTQVDGGKEHELMQEVAWNAYKEASIACTSPIPSEKFYSYCNERGLSYGESFRILKDIRWDGQRNTVGYVDVSKPTAQYAGLVHPAVIDAAAQIFWTAPSHGLSESMPTEVPHRIFDTYVAATGWKTPQTSVVRILTTSRYKDVGRGMLGSISCYAEDGALLCKVAKMEMDPIADDDLAETADKKLLYGIEWKPCLSAMNSTQLHSFCNANDFSADETIETEYLHQLDRAVCHAISNTLACLSAHDRKSVQPCFQHYISWMEQQADRISEVANDALDNDAFEKLLSEVENAKPAWRMFSAVARNLPSIIRSETDALTLLFSSDLAETFYNDIFAQLCDTDRFCSFVSLASHQNPELRILEVGAGTGGLTSHVLAALQQRELQTGGTCFVEYTYTDVSHGFFEGAKTKFQRFGERMSFKAVDLERAVTEQGIDESSYDIIIAGSVLHATKTLGATLQNLHKALKPGGKLVFFELTKPDALAMNFGFGIFPGWWTSSEAWRSQTPAVDEEQWHASLQDAGFSGNDLVLRDHKSNFCHNFSVIVSTAEKLPEHSAPASRVLIVHEEGSEESEALAEAIEALLHKTSDYRLETVNWGRLSGANIKPEDIVILLPEMIGSVFRHISESTFELLKITIQHIKQLLWVTATDTQDPSYPYSGITNGFMRTMRSENISKHIVTLMLDGIAHDASLYAHHITTVFKQVFEQRSPEVEYAVRNKQLVTARLVEESTINETMHATLQPRLKFEPWKQGPALIFNVRTPGTLDTLEFIEDAAYRPQSDLGEYELEVEAHAWGVNFRDIFMALGRLDENDYGFDCGGIVSRVGSKCTVQPGDRVIVAVIGCMRGFIRCQELEVIKLPESFRLEDAVSVTAPGITAYHSLVDTARLQKGERILIHSATGATGQVAVQIAQWIGAEIYATVGTDEKMQFLMDTYHIPKDHIFYSRNTSFAQGVMRMTRGEGVHVVLNSLSGDSLRASWECVAPYGRFIEMGKVDIKSNSGLPMSGFAKNVSFTAVDLHHVSSSRKDITQHLLSNTMRLLSSGVLRCPSPIHVYPVSQMEEAFRFFQTGKSTGRTVISISPTDVVPKRIIARPQWSFDEHASYLIAGGLGGIGRAICRWMMWKGVKHLILPSRDGIGSQAAADLIKDLRDHGVNVVAPTCDASSIESLRKVLDECAATMPPVRGCINAAMVLQDAIFEVMTHAQWEATIRSKVETSWNLHNLLPSGMDFFVLLSSLSGIYGSVSQANYAAGNTFKDALARYRTSHGEKAVAFNLGWMRTIGIIAENDEYQKLRELSADMAKIESEELLSLFDIYCDPAQPVLQPDKSQLLVGVVTPGECLAMGMEPPFNMRHPLFSGFRQAAGATRATDGKDGVDFPSLFKQAETEEAKADVIVRALAGKLGRALSMPPDDIDAAKPLFEYGVDSLVAVELRNWIGKEFAADIAVFDIMGGSTIAAIGALVAKRSGIAKEVEAVETQG